MIKKNIPYIISYILTIFIFILGGLFFRQAFLALFIIILSILPLISIFINRFVINNITVTVTQNSHSVTINNPIQLRLNITNSCLFPVLNCHINFRYANLYYPNDKANIISLPAIPRKTTTISFPFDTAHLGMNEFSFYSIETTDFLHLTSIQKPLNCYLQVAVMPEIVKEKYLINLPAFADDDEDEQYISYGQPTHDLKETREYQPGDSLKNIHWKLSAKTDGLTVKVFENSAGRTFMLLPELSKDSLDETLKKLYSFAEYLISTCEIFKILVFDANNRSFAPLTIENHDDLDNALLSLYFAAAYEIKFFALDTFQELNPDNYCCIYIKADKVIYHNALGNDQIEISPVKEESYD